MTACLAVALFGLTRRTELPAARVLPAGGVNDNRARRRVDGAASDGRCKNNHCDQCSHGTAFVDEMAFSLYGSGLAAEEAARVACARGVFREGLTSEFTDLRGFSRRSGGMMGSISSTCAT